MDNDPYRDSVLDHNRNPRNYGALAGCSHAAEGNNPLCGDRLRFELVVEQGRVALARYQGECCAIGKASASMLSERIVGLDAAQIAGQREEFESLLRDGVTTSVDFGDMNAFGQLQNYPARRKCALLAWETVQSALRGGALTTTELEHK